MRLSYFKKARQGDTICAYAYINSPSAKLVRSSLMDS